MRKLKKRVKFIIGIIALCICAASYFNTETTVTDNGDFEYLQDGLRVHFVDVGQADCTLIEMPDGTTMLIDAGNNDDGDDVVSYLKMCGIEKVDILIGTHPHEDHIGGLDDVINSFEIGAVYMPKVQSNTKTFRDVLNSVKQNDLTVKTAKSGVNIISDEEFNVKFVAPVSDRYEELNNYSAVVHLKYKNKAFLFTGDAEILSENEITGDISADVLKIGHHGSSTSTGKEFFNRVNPDYVFIPCGAENDYGHPHKETLKLLNSAGVKVYRADTDGTVIFETDGENLRVVE
ncbi:MAG: MBL fold metallo-hydrolase [Clostridia bacterium]|nr:MBL fold metallo-hydrolase [Clostridia bacterium]